MKNKTYYVIERSQAIEFERAEELAKARAPAIVVHQFDSFYRVIYLSEDVQYPGQTPYTGSLHMLYRPKVKRTPKPKPIVLPAEVWVMGYHFSTPLGSVCHISYGDVFYATAAECQEYIDNMPSWIGMGDRKQYRPVQLVSKKED